MALVLGLATAVFVADQLAKRWALARLDATHPVVVIPDFFHLVLVMNPGVAFGIFAGVPPGWRWIVSLFSLTALALLGSLAFRILPRGASWRAWPSDSCSAARPAISSIAGGSGRWWTFSTSSGAATTGRPSMWPTRPFVLA